MVFDKFWNCTLIDGQTSKMLPVASVTIGFLQMQMNWDDKHDMDGLDLWEKSYCALFILKALFALEYIRQFFAIHRR